MSEKKPCPNCGRLGEPRPEGGWRCVTEVSCCQSYYTDDDSDRMFRRGKYATRPEAK